MSSVIDLRSDTVTVPTPQMREAMVQAKVGDDVYGEDPSANDLEAYAAEITGKEAALYMPSGSMANLTALYILCGRGNEVLAHPMSHIIQYELASPAAIAGCMPVFVPGADGKVTPDDLRPYLKGEEYYLSRPTLISIENTTNKAGGTCWQEDELRAVWEFSREHELAVHMDGARVFNASLATKVPVSRIASCTDSIAFCLSKGLGAPAGSMLCGDASYIRQARRVRKLLGGGMRQIGCYAAAGLYALKHHVLRLEDDHRHARIIAEAIGRSSWAAIDPQTVETNIVICSTFPNAASEAAAMLKDRGILCGPMGPHDLRFVTHLGISEEDTWQAADIIASLHMPSPHMA